MKADSETIHKVFQYGGYLHYVLPHFQREYAWERPEWDMLLNDVFAIYSELGDDTENDQEEIKIEHFLGSLVFVEAGVVRGSIVQFTLVDGQQRLTTISLLLCALLRIVANSDVALSDKIQRLFINPHETGEVYFKLLSTTKYGDRNAYKAIILGQSLPDSESRIPKAFDHLYHALKQKIDAGAIKAERLFRVLTSALQVVRINLSKDESPYKIFESLNAKGKPLTQADLVRNFIAMTLPASGQEEVFCDHWAPIEAMLQEKRTVGRSGIGELTGFLRHYLMMDTGALYNQEHVYARFRDRINDKFASPPSFVEEIKTLHEYAVIYDRLLRLEKQPTSSFREAMQRLDVLDMTTAYPFLLAMFHALQENILTVQDVTEALRLLENYLMRRFLANEPTNYLNKMFPLLWRHIDTSNFVPTLQTALLARNYPSDTRIRQILLTRPLYRNNQSTRKQIVFLLEHINRQLSAGTGGYTVLDHSATIEHILPQTLSPEWKAELGSSASRVVEFIHTIGNLTLVTSEWNTALSNGPFTSKKAKLASHALRLNSAYFVQNIPLWNETTITERSQHLIDRILSIWPSLKTEIDEEEVTSDASTFRPQVIERASQALGYPLLRRTDRQYSSADDSKRAIITVSKLYPATNYKRYWFAFADSDGEFLANAQQSYIVLGCGSAGLIFIVPFEIFAPLTPQMSRTPNDNKPYSHIVIYEQEGGFYIGQPGMENWWEVTIYRI